MSSETTKRAVSVARRDETVCDNYHGTMIKDPYRWMEDLDSAELKAYTTELNAVTDDYLKSCGARDEIARRLKSLEDHQKWGCFRKEGDHYFYYRSDGLQNQSVLYMTNDYNKDGQVFIDPNGWSEDGTTALTMLSFSADGTMLAYGVADKGSDITTVKFKEIPSGLDMSDHLEQLICASVVWLPGNAAVLYTMFPSYREGYVGEKEAKQHSVYLHKLGTDQSADVLCFSFTEDPTFFVGLQVSDNQSWVICNVLKDFGLRNRVFVCDLSHWKASSGKLKFKPLFNKYDANYEFCGLHNGRMIFLVNSDAPHGRLVSVSQSSPEKKKWKVLLAENQHAVLEWAKVVSGSHIFVCTLEDIENKLYLYGLPQMNLIHQVDLPPCAVSAFSGNQLHDEAFVKYTSYVHSGVVMRFSLNNKNDWNPEGQVIRSNQLKDVNLDTVKVLRGLADSADGTRVPFRMIINRGVPHAPAPTILYGYGGFGINLLPSFSAFRLAFVKGFTGIFVVANLRGGGERGAKWHQDGMREKKQNVFDDLAAVATYLYEQKFSTPDLLTIMGCSNGGLLVAASAIQRPDLFHHVIADVGVLDMLRFHKFTVGHAWISEYGSPDDENDFAFLIKYSPLHNLKVPGENDQLPATLLMTASHDDRVVPWHSFKYMATLLHCAANVTHQTRPLLLRLESDAGHGAGKPLLKNINYWTDVFCFISNALNLKWNFRNAQLK